MNDLKRKLGKVVGFVLVVSSLSVESIPNRCEVEPSNARVGATL